MTVPKMGKKQETMDDKQINDKSNNSLQLRKEAIARAQHQRNSNHVTVSEESKCDHESSQDQDSSQTGEISSRLVASTSSPSLLLGCGDSTTHAGANVERHLHAHNVHVNITPHSPVSPAVQPEFNSPPFPETPTDAVFLTPSPPRLRQSSERPNSAPADQLERISGTLLRLVGDHYLCSTCGRQLRTIGDQMTLEAHMRRTFSASHLEMIHNEFGNHL